MKGGKSTNKRPRSPGLILYSPTKRRILTEEGLFSPAKKSPIMPKLDLSTPKCSGSGSGSARLASTSAASPEMTPKTRSSRRLAGQPPEIASPPPDSSRSRELQKEIEFFTSPSRPPAATRQSAPLYVPREIPGRVDPQSHHYPGFDVYQDTHILVPTKADLFNPAASDPFTKDETKENLPLKKLKAAQKATLTPRASEAASPFLTPSRQKEANKRLNTTARSAKSPSQPLSSSKITRPSFGTTSIKAMMEASPSSEVTKEERKRRMEAEVDGFFSSDEEVTD